MLEALERANLFVVALDDERRWYRYHHLFAEVLNNHLQQTEPALVSELHRRASAWYEQHELTAEAVQHALAVPDAELAARLIEPIAVPFTSPGSNLHGARVDERLARGAGTHTPSPVCLPRNIAAVHQSVGGGRGSPAGGRTGYPGGDAFRAGTDHPGLGAHRPCGHRHYLWRYSARGLPRPPGARAVAGSGGDPSCGCHGDHDPRPTW